MMFSEEPTAPKVTLKIPTKSGGSKGGSGKSRSKPKPKLTMAKPKSSSKPKGKAKPKSGGGGGGGSKAKGKGKPNQGGKGFHATPAPMGFKKKDDGVVDLEQQFMLRMPPVSNKTVVDLHSNHRILDHVDLLLR